MSVKLVAYCIFAYFRTIQITFPSSTACAIRICMSPVAIQMLFYGIYAFYENHCRDTNKCESIREMKLAVFWQTLYYFDSSVKTILYTYSRHDYYIVYITILFTNSSPVCLIIVNHEIRFRTLGHFHRFHRIHSSMSIVEDTAGVSKHRLNAV